MRLGEKILNELGEPGTNDTLTRWLSHHIAELLSAADQAQRTGTAEQAAEASKRCRAAILDLWARRSTWPQGWPPPGAKKMTEALQSIEEPDFISRRSNLPSILHRLHYKVLAALVDQATLEHSTAIERGWLEEFGELLTEDERRLLARFAERDRRLEGLIDALQNDPGTDNQPDTIETMHPALLAANAYRAALEAALIHANDDEDDPS